MKMLYLQRYPRNLNLIKNMEDTVVFLNRKVLISMSFSIALHKQDMRIAQFTFAEKPQMKINNFKLRLQSL